MSDFERYQAMMLDHLYGLLEPEHVIELNVFLATTPEGEVLRQRADEWQRQLSVAAKSEFPDLHFSPAAAKPAARPLAVKAGPSIRKPAERGVARHARHQRSWAPWAIAVSVLAVLLGFGIPLLHHAAGEMEAARQARARQAEYEKADKEHNTKVAAYNALLETAAREERHALEEREAIDEKYNHDLEAARKKINDKRFIVRLSGPERAQPGAPNEWRVDVYRRDGGAPALPGKIEWQVKDQNDRVVFADSKQAVVRDRFGEMPTVNLPVSFWDKVKPDSELTLEVVAYEDDMKSKVSARIPLARPVYITHFATDKPLYKQGEVVFFRSLTLDRATFVPPDKDMTLEFRITRPGGQPEPIRGSDGLPLRGSARGYVADANAAKELLGPDKKPLRGIGCGTYEIAPDAPGGEYTLSVVDVTPSLDELRRQVVAKNVVLETRKFNVIKYQAENILKTLEFDGKSYGAGDVVMVKCTATPIQGGKKKIGASVTVRVDGKPVKVNAPAQTDADGVLRLKFTLPPTITKGVGTIDVTFQDGANSDVISRPIPLIGRIINVEFFPEGGDLVENVPNRVYFQATTPTGKPADLKGFITDGTETVAEVATLTDAEHPGVNRGQGAFTLTPRPGKTYFLKVQKPIGILEPLVKASLTSKAVAGGIGLGSHGLGVGALAASIPTGFALPKAKPDGVVLTALDAVTSADQSIRVQLRTPKEKKTLVVGAYARGNLIDHRRVEVEAGKPVELDMKPGASASGVTRLTVFEEKTAAEGNAANLVPVAERLVYRKPDQQLRFEIKPDRTKGYNPGSPVGLDVLAMNESGMPVPAILMVAVVNQSVLTMADEKTGRLMPTHFLLASEVKKPQDLEHADFLLGENPKAAVALDLLLGTQGWRRFAEQSAADPKRTINKDVDRLLVSNGQKSLAPVDTLRQEVQKVCAEYLPRRETSNARLAEAQRAHEQILEDDPKVREEIQQLAASRAKADKLYQAALADLQQYADAGQGPSRALLLARLCIGLFLISGLCIGIGAVRRGTPGLAYFAAAAGCFVICSVALLGSSLAGRDGDIRQQVAWRGARLQPAEIDRNELVAAGADVDELTKAEEKLADDRAGEGQQKLLKRDQQMRAGVGGGGRGGLGMPPFLPRPENARLQPAMGLPAGAKPGVVLNMAAADAMKAMPRAERQQFEQELAKAGGDKQARFGQGDGKMKAAAKYRGRGEFGAMPMAPNAMLDQLRRLEPDKQVRERKPGRPQADAREDGTRADAAKDMKARDIELQLLEAKQAPGFYVREYKFQKAAAEMAQRDDFTETVFWHPVLVLPESGRADLHFQLSDAIAHYQVLVAGHTLDGRIGAATAQIEARKPFSVDPKTPFEITANDRLDVPIRIVNDSEVDRTVSFSVAPNGLTLADPALKLEQGALRDRLHLAANQKGRKIVSFRAAKKEGEVSLMVLGTSDPVETPDQVLRSFRVVPDGFPASGAVSDLLEKRANATITLPELVKGTLKVQVNVYPTSLAALQKGLESLMREPGGCFEQTSTSNYPNLLVLDYLKSSDQAKPELAQRARQMLDRGYAKLVAFECPDSADNNRHGFEWFGQMDQQHQALTAYGLLQFKDLARAYPGKVDPELIRRTQQYLLGQQNPNKEGFKRNARALDTFGRAPDYITNAYIVWALTESDPDDKEGMTDLIKQLDFLKMQATENPEAKNDPYFLALVANALLHRPGNGNRELAVAILDRIAQTCLKNGCVEGAKTSITCSGGRDLQIETTALAVLGWLRSGEPTKFIMPVKETTKWIGQQRGGYGGFGSTQSTILALKALIEFTKASRKPAEGGEVRLTVNGKVFTKSFTDKDQEVIALDVANPEEIFKQGPNEAVVEITTKQAYPFSLAWSCSATTPVSSDKRSLDLAVALDRTEALEGQMVRAKVSLTNKVDAGHGMAVAVIGLPGGCRLPADMKELKKLKEDGVIAEYEIFGSRELVLYWRSLKPKEQIDLSVSLICDIPGEFTGPASRGYLYYNADHKHWVKPLSLTIAPSNQQGDEGVASK